MVLVYLVEKAGHDRPLCSLVIDRAVRKIMKGRMPFKGVVDGRMAAALIVSDV